MVTIYSAVSICKAVQAEEAVLLVSGDNSCFHLPLFLQYIFPQTSRSCNSWRWGSHQPPPAYTGRDSALWHSPLQRRRSETQEISMRQEKTKQDSTSWLYRCSLDLALGETQVFCQKCNGFWNGSAVEEDQRAATRSSNANGRAEACSPPRKHGAARTAPGPRSCKVCSTHRTENHLPGLSEEHRVRLQMGNAEAVLVKPNPSTVVTALSRCNVFPALCFQVMNSDRVTLVTVTIHLTQPPSCSAANAQKSFLFCPWTNTAGHLCRLLME